MTEKRIKGIIAQRTALVAKMKRIHEFSITLQDDEIAEAVSIRLTEARECANQIKGLDMELLALKPEEAINAVENENMYFEIEAKFGSWLKGHDEARPVINFNDTLNTTQQANVHELRLPKSIVPTFEGDYMQWQSFYDLFCATYHDRTNLTPSQKFQFLRGYLRGEASSLIKHLPLTDAHYFEAIGKLRDRYSRKKQIINSYITTFLDQPSVLSANATSLKQLLDTSDEILRGLKALGTTAEARDHWIIRLLLNKLDNSTREKWANDYRDEEYPTIQQFLEFLQKRLDALEDLKTFQSDKKAQPHKPQPLRGHTSCAESACPCCHEENHKLYQCAKFKALQIEDRRKFIQVDRRCYNCLNINHSVFNCLSKKRCTLCKKKHHTLLHTDQSESPKQSNASYAHQLNSSTNNEVDNGQAETNALTTQNSTHSTNTVLPTAVVKFSYDNGRVQGTCRILLDSGSQVSFASESFVRKYKLSITQRKLPVAGIGKVSAGKTKGYVPITLVTEQNEVVLSVDAHVLPIVTARLPQVGFTRDDHEYLNNIKLADPSFNVPGEIDVLIGADQFFNVIKEGQIRNNQNRVIAQNTKFGWVIAGNTPFEMQSHLIMSLSTIEDIDRSLRAMWESESIPNQSTLSIEEEKCEALYKETTTRDIQGRYIVRLPFREAPSSLPQSLGLAVGRLRSIENKFTTNPEFETLYKKFMKEYADLGHMRVLSNRERVEPGYYIPHHGILKTSPTERKIRVVFDASAKTASNKSLNNILMVGPTVQSSLYSILLRFRTHEFVFTSDIQKMYRQIRVSPEDCKWQRIVWRESESLPIQHYELMTVTYGTGAAPFLATRTVNQIARDNQDQYPVAAHEIENNVYVDDIMTGAGNKSDLLTLKQQVETMFGRCGMTLSKWTSNCRELLEEIPTNNIVTTNRAMIETSDLVKVLGLLWNPEHDHFTFEIHLDQDIPYTKRKLLSEASRIFDPLGLVAPCIVPIKILFQELWKTKLAWDDELPEKIKLEWMDQRQQIRELSKVRIRRWFSSSSSTELEIHGFSDASSSAYGAVIYVRIISENENCKVTLISSKSKVAPVKCLTIPKLELSAAVLLTKMWNKIKESLRFLKIRSVTMWSDSTIVLDWLSNHNKTKDVFVRNRVALILETFNRNQWNHVPSEENPADLVSRGVLADQLINSKLWWNGPKWLKDPERKWEEIPKDPEEVYSSAVVTKGGLYECIDGTCERVSSFFTIVMIIARILRWFKNSSQPVGLRNFHMTPEDIQIAEFMIIRKIQNEHYNVELSYLKKGLFVKKSSPLSSLNPFIDQRHNILRVGGRISNAMVNYQVKHPIILPRKSALVKKLVTDAHIVYRHAGPNLLNSILKQKYYIFGGQHLARYTYQQCVQCCKAKPTAQQQMMADLPRCRVQFERPFKQIGVDYAGPFNVYHIRRRGQRSSKIYMCIFVCLATKAVHIELAYDMTANAFLAAWKRMTARRGCCSDIYSDCGSNFIGADRQLKDWYKMIKLNSNNISISLLRQKVSWHFNPPSAPHFGGIWEAAVKGFKTHLKRVVGQNILTVEEFHTVVTEIEGILNSRPLCRGDDEVDALTPAHFIIGQPITSLPEPASEKSKMSYTERWRMVKMMIEHFWNRWHREYLVSLQHRYKWQVTSQNLEVNDVVLVKDGNLGVMRWPMGRVLAVHPGQDGRVRTVTIKTQGGNVMRPIHKLCKLPLSESNDSLGAGMFKTRTSVYVPSNTVQ